MRWMLTLVGLVLAVGALGEVPETDSDLIAALDEVSAAGGLVDPEDVDPWWRADGLVRCAVRWRDDRERPLGDVRLELTRAAWQLGGRWREQDPDPVGLGWGRGALGGQRFGVGAVGYQHGLGLLSAAAGARSRLDAASPLTARRGGWCPTLSSSADSRLNAVWCDFGGGAVRVRGAMGRDTADAPAQLAAVALGRAEGLRGLWLRRDGRTGASVNLGLDRDAWRLQAEAARWDGSNTAAAVLMGWRRGAWRLEGQAAWSRAGLAMPGALRPACLWGWRGRGWALRASGRPVARFRVDVLLSAGCRADPDQARSDHETRHRAEVSLSGRRWRLRWRHDEQVVTAWLDEAPWLPPVRQAPRTVRWLAATVRQPVPLGELLLDWRRRQDAGGARHLCSVGWRRDLETLRVQIRGQLAWGDPVDLVSLSVPARGVYLVQHWGQWDGGLWVSVQRRARLGWQLMLARRVPRHGVRAAAELQGQLGFSVEF